MRLSLPRRRGLASLELVLSLPFLLAVAVIIASLAKVGLAKSSASIEARADAWRKRPAVAAAARPTLAAADLVPGTGNAASGQGSKSVRLAPVLEPAAVKAESSHFVLAGTWDHQVLRPGAGRLQVDPLMAAFVLGEAEKLLRILRFLDEGSIEAVEEIRAALAELAGIIEAVEKVHTILKDLVENFKSSSSGSASNNPLQALGNAITGGISGAANTISDLAKGKIKELWDAVTAMIDHSGKLLRRLPALVQAVGKLPLTAIPEIGALPSKMDLETALRKQVEKMAEDYLKGQLGAALTPDKIIAALDKLKDLEKELKKAIDDLKAIQNLIRDLQSGKLLRYVTDFQ